MSPGLTRGLKKGLRTVAQVAAGGGLTLLVTALTGTLTPSTAMLVMGAWTAFVAFSQNWAEGAGKMPVLLPTPSLIPGPAASTVATVEATAGLSGEIAGDVLDIAGDVVGEITGTVADTIKGDEAGGIFAGLAIAAAVVFLLLAGFCISVGDGEERSLARTADNSPCEGSCEGKQGDCREVEAGGSCEDNDLSPSFQDSPVDRSFNPVVCLPMSTCHFDGNKEEA